MCVVSPVEGVITMTTVHVSMLSVHNRHGYTTQFLQSKCILYNTIRVGSHLVTLLESVIERAGEDSEKLVH